MKLFTNVSVLSGSVVPESTYKNSEGKVKTKKESYELLCRYLDTEYSYATKETVLVTKEGFVNSSIQIKPGDYQVTVQARAYNDRVFFSIVAAEAVKAVGK